MDFEKEKPNAQSNIKKIIAVMSGKGGVGKSSVTALASVALRNKGYSVGILDADITGPSIPKLFGINELRSNCSTEGIYPTVTSSGLRTISLNLMVEDEESPVVWRGPLIANTVKQFFTDTVWGELDYLLIDLPPGTGDVPLTIMQSIPVDGLILVSSPQDLVQMIVKKSLNMAKLMKVPIIGIVENMSYIECPYCNKEIYLFGKSRIEDTAKKMGVDMICSMAIDPMFASLCDEGKIELYPKMRFDAGREIADAIERRTGGGE